MELRYSSQARGERIVSAARLLIAASFLFSLQLDRKGAGAFHDYAFPFLLVYVIFSLVAFIVAWRSGRRWSQWVIFCHGIDVVFFCSNLFIPDGSATPRNLIILFPLFCAVLLFSWKTALLTSAATFSAYMASAIFVAQSNGPDALRSQHFLYRTVGYVILSALVVYLRQREQTLEQEIAAVSSWPHDFSNRVPTRDLLELVGETLQSPRLVMAWEERDEPWLHLAWRFGSDYRWIREAPARYDPLVARDLEATSFYCRSASANGRVVRRTADGFSEWRGEAVHSALARDFSMNEVMSLRLDGTTFRGRLFVLDRRDLTPDDLLFGELVGRLVVSRLDQYHFLLRAQQLAVGEERIRVSRDLHDGVLQSLTGAALQIEAVRSMLARNPVEANERLVEIQTLLATDQRELRAFIRQLRPAGGPTDGDSKLSSRLGDLADRFQKQWGMRVELKLDGMMHLVSPNMNQEIYNLVSEAVANAAKHAEANRVEVAIASSPEEVKMTVSDDGKGFPFEGSFDLEELNRLRRGPVTLKERVTSLGGELRIVTGDQGSQLEIRIPSHWAGA